MKKGQTFSTDAVIAVVIFILSAMVLFYLMGPAANNRRYENLQSEAQKLPGILSANQNLTIIFVQGTKVDEAKLGQALKLSYDNLKSLLGMESDFCIYFEDDKGNIVPAQNKIGLGSPLVNFSGKACNETIS